MVPDMQKYIYRQAVSMANIPPTLLFAPEEAADRMEKRATIPVAVIIPNLRPTLSDIQPNVSIPKMVPMVVSWR
jgi:hypothetical protein